MQNPFANRNLKLIRTYYFLWIGAGGFLSPFVTLFYKSRGLTGTEIGLLSTFGAITGMLAAPVWGRAGDSSRHPRRLIMLALLASACFALLRGIQSLFWMISIFIVADALIGSGAGSLSNVQAVNAASGEKSGFGSIRLWGSLGWAVVTPLAGWLIESLGLYVPFAGYAVLLVAAVSVLFFVRGETRPKSEMQKVVRVPLRQMLWTLSKNKTMIGVALGIYHHLDHHDGPVSIRNSLHDPIRCQGESHWDCQHRQRPLRNPFHAVGRPPDPAKRSRPDPEIFHAGPGGFISARGFGTIHPQLFHFTDPRQYCSQFQCAGLLSFPHGKFTRRPRRYRDLPLRRNSP